MKQNQPRTYDALKSSHLFSNLSDEQLGRVYRHSSTIRLGEGEPLFIHGDPVDNFYLVISGRIKLFRLSAEGQEKIIDIVSSGQTFAEALMFMDQAHYPVNASALSESEVMTIEVNEFKNMLRNSVETCFLLMGSMSARLRGLIHEIDTLSLHTGICRVASYILEHSPDNEDSFKLDTAKSVIASRLSVKPETLSRILKELSQREILSVDGSQITIHNRPALKAISMQAD